MTRSTMLPHAHEWVVFNTALRERWLMLQCVECGLHAAVEDKSPGEWAQAFHAPSRPYRWYDESRVRVQDIKTDGRFFVMRKGTYQRCECYDRFGKLEPLKYERVPGEITTPTEILTEDEHDHLIE